MIELEYLCFFKQSARYGSIAKDISSFLNSNMRSRAIELLQSLPSERMLMTEIVEKLKNKPVGKTLQKISENKTLNKYEIIKGWLSLGVHCVIECQAGNTEYEMLIKRVQEKVSQLLYG